MQFNNLQELYKRPKDVKEYWERQAEKIDTDFNKLVAHDLYSHSWNITVKTFIDWGLITDKSRVLEVGCGWGRILVGLRKFFPGAEIAGVDITENFIKKAKSVLEQELGQCDISVSHGDAMDLDFKGSSFDTIVTTRVLQYVTDPAKAVRGFYRILKYGGRVVVCLPNKWNPVVMAKYHTKLYSAGEINEWLKSAGFNIVRKSSINFFPSSIYRFSGSNQVIHTLENILQEFPGIRNLGALACVVGEKRK